MENAFPACQSCCMAKISKKSGYRFKELREQATLTLEQLSEDVRISVSQLSRFESGDREPRVDELLRIAARLRVPWQELINAGTTGWMSVPLISFVSAGQLTSVPEAEVFADSEYVQAANLPTGDWIALRVKGSSMDRISPPESVIFVNRKDKRLVPNACYVIADSDEGASYKRYRPDPMRFEPVTFSEGHKIIFPDQEPQIIGRVKRTVLDL